MESLITAQEVYNSLNIDLAKKLKVKDQANETTVTEHFLQKAQGYLFDFINLYRYDYVDYNSLVKAELSIHAQETLKKAMYYQIEYMLQNMDSGLLGGIMLTSGGVQTIDRSLRKQDKIAPNAEDLLLTSGLCYSGRKG